MPYISPERRVQLYPEGIGASAKTAGELNYLITTIVLEYLAHDPGYQDFNNVIGALEGAKMEFYRRVVAPYEEQKIKENGDVY